MGTMKEEKTFPSHLDILKAEHPGFNWPEKGERRDYPEEIGARLCDTKHLGFPPRRYTLVYRSSCEDWAIERAEEYISEGRKAKITYNPIRLETYGVWIH